MSPFIVYNIYIAIQVDQYEFNLFVESLFHKVII